MYILYIRDGSNRDGLCFMCVNAWYGWAEEKENDWARRERPRTIWTMLMLLTARRPIGRHAVCVWANVKIHIERAHPHILVESKKCPTLLSNTFWRQNDEILMWKKRHRHTQFKPKRIGNIPWTAYKYYCSTYSIGFGFGYAHTSIHVVILRTDTPSGLLTLRHFQCEFPSTGFFVWLSHINSFLLTTSLPFRYISDIHALLHTRNSVWEIVIVFSLVLLNLKLNSPFACMTLTVARTLIKANTNKMKLSNKTPNDILSNNTSFGSAIHTLTRTFSSHCERIYFGLSASLFFITKSRTGRMKSWVRIWYTTFKACATNGHCWAQLLECSEYIMIYRYTYQVAFGTFSNEMYEWNKSSNVLLATSTLRLWQTNEIHT